VVLVGVFVLPGCSGQATIPTEEVKINGMTPGEYLDSHDPPEKVKKVRPGARPRRK
jgi:hypothetical protein